MHIKMLKWLEHGNITITLWFAWPLEWPLTLCLLEDLSILWKALNLKSHDKTAKRVSLTCGLFLLTTNFPLLYNDGGNMKIASSKSMYVLRWYISGSLVQLGQTSLWNICTSLADFHQLLSALPNVMQNVFDSFFNGYFCFFFHTVKFWSVTFKVCDITFYETSYAYACEVCMSSNWPYKVQVLPRMDF